MSETIKLGSNEDWVNFDLHGFQFEAEVFEVGRELARIERQHKSEANECADCGMVIGLTTGGDKTTCPACGSDNIRMSAAFVDAIVSLLKTRYACPRASIDAACGFYASVLSRMEAAKKKSMSQPESPIGSESIQPAGATQENAPGLQISAGCIPSDPFCSATDSVVLEK